MSRVPKTIGGCADRLYKIKGEQAWIKKELDQLEKERKEIEAWLIDNLPKSNATGVAGKLARVAIKTDEVPTAKDWPKVWAYIAKTKSWDLLQKRLSLGAVRERWADNKKIPGVEPFTITRVSLTKV